MDTDKIIQDINENSKIDVSLIAQQEVILIIGPTGSGKSVLLNMIAGSKLTCTINNRNVWEIHADPNIALIGHLKSMTFLPNYWKSPDGRIFYDCAGFNDTRGPIFDIAKSLMMKKIGDNAKSLKVILVSDLDTLNSERGGNFAKIMEQTKMFLSGFNPHEDCEIVITKGRRYTKSSGVANSLKQIVSGVEFSEHRITVISEPNEDTFQLPTINFDQIFARCPSIKLKCQVPLSNEAKLFLNELIDNIEEQVKKETKKMSYKVKLFYYQLLANNVDSADVSKQQNWFRETKMMIDILAASRNIKEFWQNLKKTVNTLDSFDSKTLLHGKSSVEKLENRLMILQYLEELQQKESIKVDILTAFISFNEKQLKRIRKQASFHSSLEFGDFLATNSIDISKDIKSQVHTNLNKTSTITKSYQGTVNKSDRKPVSGIVKYKAQRAFTASIYVKENIPYSGEISYNGSVPYEKEVYYSYCSHNSCLACDHDQTYRNCSGTAYYNGNQKYEGNVLCQKDQTVSGIYNAEGQVAYTNQIVYTTPVSYQGVDTTQCSSHHSCSCNVLSKLVNSGANIIQELHELQEIIGIQNELLGTPEPIQLRVEAQQFLSLKIGEHSLKNICEGNNEILIANNIHSHLSKQHNFTNSISGSTPFSTSQSCSGNVAYRGIKVINRTFDIKLQKPYQQQVEYSGNAQYEGCFTHISCVQECFWCTGINTKTKSYSGYASYSGSKTAYGTATKTFSKSLVKQISYDGTYPYSHSEYIQGSVPYTHTHTITCQKSELGNGHHDCSSCEVWTMVVEATKKLMKAKEKLLENINKNVVKIEDILKC